MRIAYLVGSFPLALGVERKVCEQIKTWTSMGHEVAFFTSQCPLDFNSYHGCSVAVVGRARHRALSPTRLLKSVERFSPDLVYMRFGMAEPGFIRLFSSVPVVAEVNQNDQHIYYLTRSPLFHWYHKLTRQLVWRKAAGFIFVTYELANTLPKYGLPYAVIANGIDLSMYEPLPVCLHERPSLLFIGNPEYVWHGVDDIVTFARKTPEWDYHIVGFSTFDSLPNNVRCYGKLSKIEYTHIATNCHVAIGTLGLYKTHLNEAAALKVREYLAWGMPVILGNVDTDFMHGTPFILTVPNRPNGMLQSICDVQNFVRAWMTLRVQRSAVKHLDVSLKEMQRLKFFQTCITRH